jgi:hypothetical protein
MNNSIQRMNNLTFNTYFDNLYKRHREKVEEEKETIRKKEKNQIRLSKYELSIKYDISVDVVTQMVKCAYASFHSIPLEDINISSASCSSAGLEGWLNYYKRTTKKYL